MHFGHSCPDLIGCCFATACFPIDASATQRVALTSFAAAWHLQLIERQSWHLRRSSTSMAAALHSSTREAILELDRKFDLIGCCSATASTQWATLPSRVRAATFFAAALHLQSSKRQSCHPERDFCCLQATALADCKSRIRRCQLTPCYRSCYVGCPATRLLNMP